MTRIKGWSKFQHFKDRRPPWVKLYRDLLDDPDWHDLSGSDGKTLVMLWLIASENDGELPCVRKLAFRLRQTEKSVNDCLKRLSHWLEQDDIGLISERYQVDAPETETETETETEREGETEARKRAVFVKPTVDEVAAYCRERGNSIDAEQFVAHYESNGWKVGGKAAMKDWKAAVITWEKRNVQATNGTSRKPVFEQPHERRARELNEALARAEGAESLEADDGNLRGQVLEGVWSRAE